MKYKLLGCVVACLITFNTHAENLQADTAKILFVGPSEEVMTLYDLLDEADRYIKQKEPNIKFIDLDRQVWVQPKKEVMQVTYSQGLGKDSWTLDLKLDKQFKVIKYKKQVATEPPPPSTSDPKKMIQKNTSENRKGKR